MKLLQTDSKFSIISDKGKALSSGKPMNQPCWQSIPRWDIRHVENLTRCQLVSIIRLDQTHKCQLLACCPHCVSLWFRQQLPCRRKMPHYKKELAMLLELRTSY